MYNNPRNNNNVVKILATKVNVNSAKLKDNNIKTRISTFKVLFVNIHLIPLCYTHKIIYKIIYKINCWLLIDQ